MGLFSTGRELTSLPSIQIFPLSGVSKPAISRKSVDLPQPLCPKSVNLSPSPISREMSLRTDFSPNDFETDSSFNILVDSKETELQHEGILYKFSKEIYMDSREKICGFWLLEAVDANMHWSGR